MEKNQNTQNPVATIPDFNYNQEIAAWTETAAAYVGAAATCVAGGLLTALASAVRGAVKGAQITIANAGEQKIEVPNTSVAAKAQTSVLDGITQEDLELLMQMKRQRQEEKLLSLSTNGH